MPEFKQAALPGVLILKPRRFWDHRGFFCEIWNARWMVQARLHFSFVQDNRSLSSKAGTVLGLHFQAPPHAQDKLVLL